MYRTVLALALFIAGFISSHGQNAVNGQVDINNLLHTPSYTTSEWNVIPPYEKKGNGKKVMLLIPGLGFDGSIFSDFIEANQHLYTMYVLTIPGYGKTFAPPMPDTTVSYGELSWNKSVLRGIGKLLDQERLSQVIVVGHFIQGTQLAIQLALERPEKVEKLIVMGGAPKLVAYQQGKLTNYPLAQMVKGVDTYYAPVWFKKMTKNFYDDGNFIPSVYSVDSMRANRLWNQVAGTPMPVAVRYSCEYFASDVLAVMDQIRCPMLVLRPSFGHQFFENPMNANWIKPQFIDSWDIAKGMNPRIVVKDIEGAATFLWKDQPQATYRFIGDFIKL
jgi:pimeloyl-ACP methyl ester carboxylesterase